MNAERRMYIAGPFEEREKIVELMVEARRRGYEITHDWTEHKPISPFREHADLAGQYAGDDLRGVQTAKVFMLFPGESGGSGRFVELGVAIATAGVERVFVVGPHNDRTLMFFHTKVERVGTVEEVWARLDEGDS